MIYFLDVQRGRRACFHAYDKGKGFDYNKQKGERTMMEGYQTRLLKIASQKKADFRLKQEEVAKRYDEAQDAAVTATLDGIDRFIDKQISKFEEK